MKRRLNNWLMAAVVCGLCLSITSCQQEDEFGMTKKDYEAAAAKAEKISKFWDVVGQLVSMNDYTEEYSGRTFEPIIGAPMADDSQTRIVATNSAALAAQRFAQLAGVESGIDENTATYTFKDKEIGTLTYTKVTDGTAWATVDVSIKQVPHLTKIIYRSAEQGDTNGGVTNGGRAYYRFGDIVARTRPSDNVKEYWVCVRPAFDPEGKGTTHWASVSPVPADNIWSYTGSNKKVYKLFKDIPYDKEHMQNLAELLYAIYRSDKWAMNIEAYSTSGFFGPGGLPIFHDFNKKNIGYHNRYFWENVRNIWEQRNYLSLLFGTVGGAYIIENIDQDGLYLLYKNCSWNTWWSNGPTFYQAHYVNTPDGVNANMQTSKPLSEVQHDVIYKKNPSQDLDLDITTSYTTDTPYLINEQFFGDRNPRFIVRIAEGAELSSTGKYENNQMPISGVENVYRYYHDVNYCENLDQTPEQTGSEGGNNMTKWKRDDFKGRGYYKLGEVYKDENGHRWFVINMSGQDKNCPTKEASPVAELVSFDGLTLSADNSYVANLGTFDQTVRAAYFLHTLFVQTEVYTDALLPKYISGRIAKNIWDHAGVDVRHTFQQVVKSGGVARDANHHVSLAYRDASVTTGQPLARMLYLIGVNDEYNENPPYHFWKNYVTTPNATSIVYESKAFGTERILLQHVAKQDYVTKYAEDYYARLALWRQSGGDAVTVREPRKQADDRANNPANYYFNNNAFTNHTFPGDMWNAPVLMFRVDAVYDRGDEGHANVTLGGHTLTLVSTVADLYDKKEESYPGEVDDNIENAYAIITGANDNMKRNTNYLNGAVLTVPTWKQAWTW